MLRFKSFLNENNNYHDPRGIPIVIQQGRHSLSPEERKAEENPGTPAQIEQGKHSRRKKELEEDVSNWLPGFKPQKKEYTDPNLRYGTAAQRGIARRNQSLPGEREIYRALDERYKHDNINHLENDNIDTYSDAIDHHEEHQRTLEKHYSEEPSEDLQKYSESSFELNRHLWEAYARKIKHNEEIDDINISNLDYELENHTLHKPLYVYSGIKRNPGILASLHPKNRLFLPGYTSTSIKPSIAGEFASSLERGNLERGASSESSMGEKHILRIHVPQGSSGYYLGSRSHFDNEHEFLLPRQTSLHIDKKPESFDFTSKYSINPMNRRIVNVWNARVLLPNEI